MEEKFEKDEVDLMALDEVDEEADICEAANELTKVLDSENEAEKFVFEKPTLAMTKHIRPLYITAMIGTQKVNKILVDNGAAINITPKTTLRKLKQSTYTITSSSVVITSFAEERRKAEAVVTVHVTVGSRVCETCFFVVRTGSSYNALLGRDWIHANKCVPSSMYQHLQILDDGNNVQIITADPCPFNAEIHNAES